MRLRNWARMMQPPRQIFEIAPRSMFQSYSAAPARISSKPCEYATIFDAYRARRTSSMNASASATRESPRPGRAGRPTTARCSGWDESERANTASAMPETGTPRSSAVCTVHAPVPFAPAWSRITSTSGLPVSASTWRSTSAVISIRYDSSSPRVPLGEDVGDLGGGLAGAAADQVVGLGDQLHVGVLDAVVHHLHEVAGAVVADVRDARLALGDRGDATSGSGRA